jgi:hypothetical protein
MLRIVEFPEAVMNAIEPDLDELEVAPVDVRRDGEYLEVLPAHVVDLIPASPCRRFETSDAPPDNSPRGVVDGLLQLGRVRELRSCRIGSENSRC